MALTVKPVTGTIGAEIEGVNLRQLDNAAVEEIKDILHEYEVVFFRGAHLDEAEHLMLAQKFGAPSIYPPAKLHGATEPTLTTITDGPDSPPEADMWHTDLTWVAEPPRYALLCSLISPERGGDTLWASLSAAFEALSPAMRNLISGLNVVHDSTAFVEKLLARVPGPDGEEMARRHLAAFPAVTHPLVRTHPETGKQALFLGPSIKHIQGLTPLESKSIVEMLWRHIEDSRFHCRWRWTEGDLAIWDERSTCHRSAADHFPQHRAIRRIEIDGDRPF